LLGFNKYLCKYYPAIKLFIEVIPINVWHIYLYYMYGILPQPDQVMWGINIDGYLLIIPVLGLGAGIFFGDKMTDRPFNPYRYASFCDMCNHKRCNHQSILFRYLCKQFFKDIRHYGLETIQECDFDDLAQDLALNFCQEVFGHNQHYIRARNTQNYFFTLFKNQIIKFGKKTKRRKRIMLLPDEQLEVLAPVQSLVETLDPQSSYFKGLSKRNIYVLIAYYQDALSVSEIAKQINLTTYTVYQILHRSKKRIQHNICEIKRAG
jgi:RNA polymerase sigma factor (sigma-70 family)